MVVSGPKYIHKYVWRSTRIPTIPASRTIVSNWFCVLYNLSFRDEVVVITSTMCSDHLRLSDVTVWCLLFLPCRRLLRPGTCICLPECACPGCFYD